MSFNQSKKKKKIKLLNTVMYRAINFKAYFRCANQSKMHRRIMRIKKICDDDSKLKKKLISAS